jgi:hypothetical protein
VKRCTEPAAGGVGTFILDLLVRAGLGHRSELRAGNGAVPVQHRDDLFFAESTLAHDSSSDLWVGHPKREKSHFQWSNSLRQVKSVGKSLRKSPAIRLFDEHILLRYFSLAILLLKFLSSSLLTQTKGRESIIEDETTISSRVRIHYLESGNISSSNAPVLIVRESGIRLCGPLCPESHNRGDLFLSSPD